MSDPEKSHTINEDSITYFSAASAGVAQSIAMGSQNAVDELRNQSIVKTTVMGATYAKWLANPQVGEQLYQPVLDSLTAESPPEQVTNRVKGFVNMTLSPSPVSATSSES